MLQLRKNQIEAINVSIENNFKSGIHFHCTGSGKSVIALELLLEYNKRYPKHNVIWICEQKSILIEQFDKLTLLKKGYHSLVTKIFHILNYVENKQSDWTTSVNSSKFWWNKPTLLIINRAFLTSSTKYRDITLPFHLIIHDECHSIVNKTTQDFYTFIQEKYTTGIKCIGFTATPIVKYKPFDTILSKYNIYDAIKDNVIVPPKILFFTSDETIRDERLFTLFPQLLSELRYKKIIIWCGILNYCYKIAQQFKTLFPDYKVCIDTSETDSDEFTLFSSLEEKAILFCAAKHREGSDIKNLDGCIFLDGVSKRSSKTFIQCIGRVLRKDPNGEKQYGLIIDCKAKNELECCNRLSSFLSIDDTTNSTKFNLYSFNKYKSNYNDITIHSIELNNNNNSILIDNPIPIFDRQIDIDYVVSQFVRSIKNTTNEYKIRLNYELQLLSTLRFFPVLMCAVEILKFTNYIPHVTRGSCGSSLVCYLLGISHVDPIKYNISFARFCNKFRDNLPDIDFDFPHLERSEIFLKLETNWPGKVARISNHVYYHKPSALRESIRQEGIRSFISKFDLDRKVASLSNEVQTSIKDRAKKLENTFKGYSLHCGGIVYFPNGVPEELKLKNKVEKSDSNQSDSNQSDSNQSDSNQSDSNQSDSKIKLGYTICSQIICNKVDIAKSKLFKIDILSSRALSQLLYIYKLLKKRIDYNLLFDDIKLDEKTFLMLSKGDNIGITLGESPLIRKAFMLIKPKSIEDIALCLAIIRPAAKTARQALTVTNTSFSIDKNVKDEIVYDDDVIYYIKSVLNCSEDEADQLRRKLSSSTSSTFSSILESKNIKDKTVIQKLKDIREYSFCKSHSLSYAQLVYQLAYMKANHPVEFWKSTLKHNESSYKKWVHIFEASCVGVEYVSKNNSIYASIKRNKISEVSNPYDQLREFGYFTSSFFKVSNCYLLFKKGVNDTSNEVIFNGIIASQRKIAGSKLLLYVCVGEKKYFDLIIQIKKIKTNFSSKFIGCKGSGILINKKLKEVEAQFIEYF
jgi:superfamily II DNA or RNA helicase